MICLSRLCLSSFILCLYTSAHAENLEDVYQLAVKNDQQFQNATATRQATAEALPQALSVLFPAISAQGTTVMNRSNTVDSGTASDNGITKYNQHGYSLTLAMPLINFNNWYTVSQASATAKSADATYADAAQNLIIRTAQTYFAVLQAEDNLRNTRAQKDLLEKQLKQSKARYEVGVDAMTSVYNAEAAYDSAKAQEISDENSLYSAYQNLQVMTGKPIDHLSRLVDQLPLQTPNPNDLAAWQKAAESRNFSLLALRYSAEAAEEGIKASNANHLPNLSTNGTYTYAQQSPNSGDPLKQTVTSSAVGLQLNVPLFAGGQVLSQTRQAQDEYVQASTQLELQHRQVLAQTYQTYSSILAGISKIEADRAAIKSANSALQSNQAAYQAGTMTIVDVLQAVQNLYASEKDYTADQYGYLVNTISLKQLAGNLTNLDISNLNKWMTNGGTTSAKALGEKTLMQGNKTALDSQHEIH